MQNKSVKIYSDIEKQLPQNWKTYCNNHKHIAEVHNEIQAAINELNLAEKVGKFDNYYEKEAPRLNSQIKNCIRKIKKLIETEMSKEKKREIFKVDISQYEIKSIGDTAGSENQISNYASFQESSHLVQEKIEEYWLQIVKILEDSNAVKLVATTVVLLGIQFVFHLKNQENLKAAHVINVKVLENRINMASEENNHLNIEISNLRQQLNVAQTQLQVAKQKNIKSVFQIVNKPTKYSKRNPSSIEPYKLKSKRR